MCSWVKYTLVQHVDWHLIKKHLIVLTGEGFRNVCCRSAASEVFTVVEGEPTLQGHQWLLLLDPDRHVTSSIKSSCDCCWFEVIVSQSVTEESQASQVFFLLFFPVRFYCTGFTFTNRCVAFTMRFKSREDLDQDNSWSHHTFVLQARGEVSFMRRLRRHREKQLMKTKLQFPDAFELLAPLIWLSSFRCQCSYKYRLSHRLTFLLRGKRGGEGT